MTARAGKATDRHKAPLQQRTSPIGWLTGGKAAYKKTRGGGRDPGATSSLGRSGDVVHVANGQGQSPVATSAWMERALASSMQSTHSPSASRYWPYEHWQGARPWQSP